MFGYRLGIFGFLASDELGTSGNYGLKDQACAFKWVIIFLSILKAAN
jgi:carboxylesterase type B